ncbi:MAG: hypothetical protein JWM51_172, partial [Microbacteriaceae bacterium]|nr:hypothetical protein [Microbacteriaceae bacterium]
VGPSEYERGLIADAIEAQAAEEANA